MNGFSIPIPDVFGLTEIYDLKGRFVAALSVENGMLRWNGKNWKGTPTAWALPSQVPRRKNIPAPAFMGLLNDYKKKFKITISIGISESSPKDKTKDDILRRADKALYWAKEHGRDQIVIYEKVFYK